MDQATDIDVQTVMDGMGLDEIEASFVVALARGEIHGDVEPTGAMTPADRRLMGLDIVAGEEGDPDLERDPERIAEIVRVMAETGVDEIEAAFIAGFERGDIDGDILFTAPVTSARRRRMGLDLVAGEDDALDLDDDEGAADFADSGASPNR